MRIFLLFVLCLTVSGLFAQTPISLDLAERVEDDKISKSLAILPVYKYIDNSIEPYTMFGVKDKPEQAKLTISQLPNMKGCRDTGYTYIFFSGANNDLNQGYLLALIGNYKRSTRDILLFIDRNNNLDLSDDGVPDTVHYQDKDLMLRLQNLSNPKAEHFIKISRIQYGQNVKYKQMLTEHYKLHSGTKVFTNINYCFREQRYNTLSGKYKTASDSFTIALKDMNNNGLFNESCADKFYVGSYSDKVQTDVMTYVLPQHDQIFFEWNKKRYQIKSIDPTGKNIEFVELPSAKLDKRLELGKKLPKFSFVNLDNQREQIKSYRKKTTFIYFWDIESISDEDTMYLGKIKRELESEVNIVTLNHGDEPKKVRMMRYYDEIQWPMAFSSLGLSRLFYVESLPRGFLTSKRLKLKSDAISPKEVYTFYSEKMP